MLRLLHPVALALTRHQRVTFTWHRVQAAIYVNIAVMLQVTRIADHALIVHRRSICTSQNIQGIMSVNTVVILQVMRIVDHAQKAHLKSMSIFKFNPRNISGESTLVDLHKSNYTLTLF